METAGEGVSTFITTFTDNLALGLTPLQSIRDAILQTFGVDAATVFDDISATLTNIIGILTTFGENILTAFGVDKKESVDGVKNAVTGFFDALRGVSDWIVENQGWLEPLIVGVLAMVAAFKVWTAVTTLLTIAQGILNAVMLANPIGIIILAIAGLVAAFVYLWKTNEKFRNIVLGVWNAVKGAVIGVWNFFKTLPTKFGNALKNLSTTIGEKFDDALATIKSIFTIDTLLDIGKDLISGLWNGIDSMADWIGTKISEFVDNITGVVKAFFGIKSPSKLFETEIGVNLALGLGKGFAGGLPDVMSDMRRSVNTEMGRFSMMGAGSTTSNMTVNFNQPQTSYSDTLAAMRTVEKGLAW
jgi:phage-related protein